MVIVVAFSGDPSVCSAGRSPASEPARPGKHPRALRFSSGEPSAPRRGEVVGDPRAAREVAMLGRCSSCFRRLVMEESGASPNEAR